MRVIRTPAQLRSWREAIASPTRVALVPTMGSLHAGHLSLIAEARRRVPAGHVVVTIFVNPTQFAPHEDLEQYPRDEAGDLAKAESAGADVAFCPTGPALMYPSEQTWVVVDGLSRGLCGASRPGHFRGVCTVVAKLWGLTRPDVAVFGEKDYQQLAILRRMHADLFLSGSIVGMPIVREADGLAMSSRNARLTATQRAQAAAIPAFTAEVRRRFASGARTAKALGVEAAARLAPGEVDYVALVDAESLAPVATVRRPAVLALAVRFGEVRLIDNLVLRPDGPGSEPGTQ